MDRDLWTGLAIAAMIATIVSLDVLFLRHRFVLRLITNVSVVAVFALVYFLFLKRL